MAAHASKKAIYAAPAGNSLIAVTKFGAAALTGCSATSSEAIRSVVAKGEQVHLLYGLKRASRPAGTAHPFGYGMLGLVVAYFGVLSSDLYGLPMVDGVASIGIGLILAGTAVLLAYESKGLLIGEGARPAVTAGFERIVAGKTGRQGQRTADHAPGATRRAADSQPRFRRSDQRGPGRGDQQRAGDLDQDVHPEVTRVFIEARRWRAHQHGQTEAGTETASGAAQLPSEE